MKKILFLIIGILASVSCFGFTPPYYAGFDLNNFAASPNYGIANYYKVLTVTCNGKSKSVGPSSDYSSDISDLFSGNQAHCSVTATLASGSKQLLASFGVLLNNQKKSITLNNLSQYHLCQKDNKYGVCNIHSNPTYSEEILMQTGVDVDVDGVTTHYSQCFCPVKVLKQ